MLAEFGPEIWTCAGPIVTAGGGFHYPTRMVVIRLSDGRLVLWSPVALSDQLAGEIEGLGPVGYIVAPNALHDTFFAQWQAHYPEATALVAPGLRKRRPDLRAAEFGDAPIKSWSGEIDYVAVTGNAITTEIVFFHHASRTAGFTDLLQQFPNGWFKGWRSVAARFDLMTGDEPHVPRKFRIAFIDRSLARRAIEHILAWPTERVLMAHGTPVQSRGREFLQRAFAWLVKPFP